MAASGEDDSAAGTDLRTSAAHRAFGRALRRRRHDHHLVRAYLDTGPAPGAHLLIHLVNPGRKDNGSLRTGVGAYPALVAKMNAVVPRGGKSAFYAQQSTAGLNQAEIFQRTTQAANSAAGTILMNEFNTQECHSLLLMDAWIHTETLFCAFSALLR
jgi:hypothetical protein